MKESKNPKVFCPLRVNDLVPLNKQTYYCKSCQNKVFDLREDSIPKEAQNYLENGKTFCSITNGDIKKAHHFKSAFFSISFILLSSSVFAQVEEELPDSLIPSPNPNFVQENQFLGVHVGTVSEPIDGYENFYQKLSKNLEIPDSLLLNKSGKVYIHFEVDTSGNIGNFKITNSYSAEVDQLLIEAIKNVDVKFIPAVSKGKKQKTRFTLPVTIKSD